MPSRSLALSLALAISAVTASGCRRPVAPVPEPVTTSTTTTTSSTSTTAGTTAVDSARIRADALARQRADSIAAAARATAAAGQEARAEMLRVLQERVYFDYDRDNLRDDAASLLDAKAAILLANPSITVAITGHTDERGTAEYNLALGQRRAAQVKRYLVSKGIAEERVATQSLGDSEPASGGTDEASYQQNRRAEFTAANAGGAMVRP